MKIILDNEPVDFLFGRIDIILENGSHFTIWEGNGHIVISCRSKFNLLITPMQGNAVKIESDSEE